MTENIDPLPSWNDITDSNNQRGGIISSKRRIRHFVERVSDEYGDDYVAPAERIAVFDNDGTLWSEHPFYFQLYFACERIQAMIDANPEWKSTQPFKAALEGDMKTLLAGGERTLLELLGAAHVGMKTDTFAQIVSNWINSARHPSPPGTGNEGRRFKDMVFQPMLELLDYLRANQFKTYIVSGGGLEFMRPWTEEVYGIPPEQVVGTHFGATYYPYVPGEDDPSVYPSGDEPYLRRNFDYHFVDDKAGKPVGIHRFIGRRPIAAIGNSTGDQRMLEWVTYGNGLRFGLLVNHDDGEREFNYQAEIDADPDAYHCGTLHDETVTEANSQDWVIVSMADEWNTIYPELHDIPL